MPVYEFLCGECGGRETVFKRAVTADVPAPVCSHCSAGPERMTRAVTKFAQHKTLLDQVADAESKFGKQMDAVMGPKPDIGKYARRYDQLAKDLPNPENL